MKNKFSQKNLRLVFRIDSPRLMVSSNNKRNLGLSISKKDVQAK